MWVKAKMLISFATNLKVNDHLCHYVDKIYCCSDNIHVITIRYVYFQQKGTGCFKGVIALVFAMSFYQGV